MAIEYEVTQSTAEEKVYPLDFSPGLLEGVEVTNVDISYSGDNAEDNQPNVGLISIDTDTAFVKVSGLEVGRHKVRCLATTDNDDLSPEIVLLIVTNY